MRLLHCTKLYFEEFFDNKIPEYAILSHRWEDGEVSLEDFLAGRKSNGAGYVKIKQACRTAATEGYIWVWIDTCCIDKKSSAELSEAINSMYRWYQSAKVCYAYLSDVSPSRSGLFPDEDFGPWEESFQRSLWFKRGWTLQELVAPKKVIFLDRHWHFIGTKNTLAERISTITGIDVELCKGSRNAEQFSAAQKMSWAAKRKTSKIEDIAYCLLGIFDINMPLLYGEGVKAFHRLQEEIIRNTDDESIFAWFSSDTDQDGLLAQSPDYFADSGDVRTRYFDQRKPYSITNRGLQMDVSLLEAPNESRGHFLIPLSCSKDRQSPLALLVHKGDLINDRYIRRSCIELKSAGFEDHAWSFEGLRRQVVEIHLRSR
jgi:hypothetical protein